MSIARSLARSVAQPAAGGLVSGGDAGVVDVEPTLRLSLDYRLSTPNVKGPLPTRVSTDFDATRGILIDDADGVPVLSGASFSSIYNATQGTFFVEFERAASAASAWIMYASNGTTAERIEIYIDSADVRRGRMAVGGTLIGNINGGAYSPGNFKMAIAYDATSLLFAVNGTVYTDASIGSVPTLSELRIGDVLGGGNVLGDYLKLFRYYNVKQTSEWLVTETTL